VEAVSPCTCPVLTLLPQTAVAGHSIMGCVELQPDPTHPVLRAVVLHKEHHNVLV